MSYNDFGKVGKKTAALVRKHKGGKNSPPEALDMEFRFSFLDVETDLVDRYIRKLSSDLKLLTGANTSADLTSKTLKIHVPAKPAGSETAWRILRTMDYESMKVHIGSETYMMEVSGGKASSSFFSDDRFDPILALNVYDPMSSPSCYALDPVGMDRYLASKNVPHQKRSKIMGISFLDRQLIRDKQDGEVAFPNDEDLEGTTLTDLTLGAGMIMIHELFHDLERVRKFMREDVKGMAKGHNDDIGVTDDHIQFMNGIRDQAQMSHPTLSFGNRVDHPAAASTQYRAYTKAQIEKSMTEKKRSNADIEAQLAIWDLVNNDGVEINMTRWRNASGYFLLAS